ncbi:MAG: RNA 2',3'-cyclic phosphodiesterase [Pseudomonadota bacterium]
MIRSFVALRLPDDLLDALETLQAELTVGALVPVENFHVTLAFLGNLPRPVLEDLHLSLEKVSVKPFEVEISGLGQFGGRESRTAHAEVVKTDPLQRLRDKIHRAAEAIESAVDRRRFHPHVTLSRLKTLLPEDRMSLERWTARHAGFHAGPSLIESFGLFESRLTKGGPVYDLLAEYPLR